jgi:hypothetical protein
LASDFLPERSFSFVEPFAFCDSRPATAAGQGRAFTLLVLLVLMATIGATSFCVGSVSESKFVGRRLGRLSFEPAR